MKTNEFTEVQKFRQWWFWIILLGINGVVLYEIIEQVFLKEQWNSQTSTGLFIAFGGTLLLTLLFVYVRLETYINEEGVHVRFFPFPFTYKSYAWTDISKAYVKKCNMLLNYGGWGWRLGGGFRLGFKGRAYTVSGNFRLQLELFSGKSVLIGTNKPEELTETLIAMKKLGQ